MGIVPDAVKWFLEIENTVISIHNINSITQLVDNNEAFSIDE